MNLRTHLTAGLFTLAALVLLMLAGVIPNPAGEAGLVFRSPVFGILGGILAALLAGSAARFVRRRQWAECLAHLGAAVILAGGLIDSRWAIKAELQVPVGAEPPVERLDVGDRRSVDFGFGISVPRFEVVFYEPDYYLYQLRTGAPASPEQQDPRDFELVGKFRVRPDGLLDLGRHGQVKPGLLGTPEGEWTPMYRLNERAVLQLGSRTPRSFDAVLRIDQGARKSDQSLRVNHPVSCQGWKFYLMSYGDDGVSAGRTAVLLARRAPGRPAVVAGIWMCLIGVTVLGFRRTKVFPAAKEPCP
jgi:hypothetical protein